MRDREFINRFCAFRLLGLDEYRGDMDDFLAKSLRMMNKMTPDDLSRLSDDFQRSMENNYLLFETHAFSRSFLGSYEQPERTRRVKEASSTESFLEATGKSLNAKTMRDRELVNRFCAFRLLDLDEYRGDMDDFLARSLRMMNKMTPDDLSRLSDEFQRSMENNYLLFETHAFSRSFLGSYERPGRTRRVLNASIWDVMSTGLSRYNRDRVTKSADDLRKSFCLDEELDAPGTRYIVTVRC